MLGSYGLELFEESEDVLGGVVAYVLSEGKVLPGYYGAPYVFKKMGQAEFWASTEKDADGKYYFSRFHTHCGGIRVWDMICTDIDLTPEKHRKTERILMMSRSADNGGMLPVDIINADVLPSFLKGEKLTLQVVAPCLEVAYYATQEDYDKTLPADTHGRYWRIANGSLFPLSFLSNHLVTSSEDLGDEKPACEDDQYVYFTATVKALYHGQFEMEGEAENTFIRCLADTQFGELEFHHSFEQVPEDLRDNIKVGAVISGVCILSADAALNEYENGMVKDFDHDLRLLRCIFQKGEAERLRSVLTEASVYETETYHTSYFGPDAIIDRFNYVEKNHKGKYFAHMAEITETEAEGMEFPVGTKCLVLAADEEDQYESIIFMTSDDEGNIERILICRDSRYHFRIIPPLRPKTPLDDIKAPESVAEPIMARAMFHFLLESDTEFEEIKDDPNYHDHEQNAQRMLDAWKTDQQPDAVKTVGYLLGYLFAKAVEKRINEKRFIPADPNVDFRPADGCWGKLTASYRPYEALRGELSTTLEPEEHAALVNAMELAQQFGKDVFVFMEMTDKTDDDFIDIFKQAAVIVQRIGELYADNGFEIEKEGE